MSFKKTLFIWVNFKFELFRQVLLTKLFIVVVVNTCSWMVNGRVVSKLKLSMLENRRMAIAVCPVIVLGGVFSWRVSVLSFENLAWLSWRNRMKFCKSFLKQTFKWCFVKSFCAQTNHGVFVYKTRKITPKNETHLQKKVLPTNVFKRNQKILKVTND